MEYREGDEQTGRIYGKIVFKPVMAERKNTMAQKTLNAEEISELSSSPYSLP